jgi:hypothetical protein
MCAKELGYLSPFVTLHLSVGIVRCSSAEHCAIMVTVAGHNHICAEHNGCVHHVVCAD